MGMMPGHHIPLSACRNAASTFVVDAAVAIGAFVFRPRRLTVTIGCDLIVPTKIWKTNTGGKPK